MAAEEFPRNLVRKVENLNFPLLALAAVREIRGYLDAVEVEAILKARLLNATADDIAEALGITRQGAYYKLKNLEKRAEDDPVLDVPDLEPDLSD
ncbi:MAG: hypothetical protein HY240_03925 [Actinobacteria bacterium]|nr:hypothetical protein [Actinomycetota bacterium]